MPLYEYRCKACGFSFEKIQTFTAEPERVCPRCSGELVRPISAPALQFKGSGWYINDYAAKGASASSDGGSGSTPSANPSSASSSSDSGSAPAATQAAESTPAAPAPSSSPAPSAS